MAGNLMKSQFSMLVNVWSDKALYLGYKSKRVNIKSETLQDV